MTCIVGLIDKEIVYIGGDSAGSAGNSVLIRKDKKVFIKDNKFIIGFTTSFRMGQLLMCDDRFSVRDQNKEEDDFHFMINAFIPAIQKLFTEGGFLTKDREELIGGVFLVGYKQHLYKIESDFQVVETYDNYMSCGCGDDLALGSLYTSSTLQITPEEKIIKALEAAAKFSNGVEPPYNILQLCINESF